MTTSTIHHAGRLAFQAKPAIRLPERFDVHRVEDIDWLHPLPGERLGVDGSDVRFADATAIQSLVDARLRFLEHGADLHIVKPSTTLQVTLELTGDMSLLAVSQEAASCTA